jgi:hypothetical protein
VYVYDKNGRVRVKHKLWRPVKSRSDIVGTFGLHSGAIELPMTDSVESMSEPLEQVRLVWPPSSRDMRRWWLKFGFLGGNVELIINKEHHRGVVESLPNIQRTVSLQNTTISNDSHSTSSHIHLVQRLE